MKVKPRPTTFSFERPFDDLPLSGIYEVTADDDGEWFISSLWLWSPHGDQIEIEPWDAMWPPIADAITARHARAIEERLAEEGLYDGHA